MNSQRLKRLFCCHKRVTYHGHPSAPQGMCLECGSLVGLPICPHGRRGHCGVAGPHYHAGDPTQFTSM